MSRSGTTITRTALLALAACLALAGCSGTTEEPEPSTDDTSTTSAPPELTEQERQDAAQEQVIAYFERLRGEDFKDEDGYLTEAASSVAQHELIDQNNQAIKDLRDGGRTYRELGSEMLGAEVVDFVEDDPDPEAAWTIRINMCIASRTEYIDADGTVLADPDEPSQAASLVTARYDGVNDAWMLSSFEKGDEDLCTEYFDDTSAVTV